MAQATARSQLAQNRSDEDLTTAEYDYGVTNTANPYSQQAQLNRQQKIEGIDALNAGARYGGVRSGAYKVRNANLVFSQGQQQDALQRNYQKAKLAFSRNKEDITSTYNQDLYNAGAGSVQRKLEADQAAGLQAAADAQTEELKRANAQPLSWSGATGTLKTVKPKRYTNRIVLGKNVKKSLARRV